MHIWVKSNYNKTISHNRINMMSFSIWVTLSFLVGIKCIWARNGWPWNVTRIKNQFWSSQGIYVDKSSSDIKLLINSLASRNSYTMAAAYPLGIQEQHSWIIWGTVVVRSLHLTLNFINLLCADFLEGWFLYLEFEFDWKTSMRSNPNIHAYQYAPHCLGSTSSLSVSKPRGARDWLQQKVITSFEAIKFY